MCAAMPALLLAHPLFTENDTGAGEAVCGAVSGLEWSASGAVNTEVLVCCGGVPPASQPASQPSRFRATEQAE